MGILLTATVAFGQAPLSGVSGNETPAQTQSEQSTRSTEPPIRFRRIFAPANKIEQWPRGTERYIPVDPEEFERLITTVENQAGGADGEDQAPRLERASYHAELKDNRLSGEAQWSVAHSGEHANFLPLDPCSVAIGPVTWSDGSEGGAVGLDPRGRLVALVDRGGQLNAPWSAIVETPSEDSRRVALAFPRCPVNSLRLVLPAGWSPVANDASLVERDPGADDGVNQWLIEFGASGRVDLNLKRAGKETAEAMVFARQRLTYTFSIRGVELLAAMELTITRERLEQLSLHLDSPLEILSVTHEGANLPWLRDADPGNAQAPNVEIRFPQPLSGQQTVLVRAYAPLELGRLWQLPGVTIPTAYWQDTRAELNVPAPLAVHKLNPRGARQIGLESTLAGSGGEQFTLQYFSAEGGCELRIDLEQRQFSGHEMSLLRFDRGELSGQSVADISLPEGERFTVSGLVAPTWTIESVTTIPPEAISDWQVEQRRGQALLEVQLSRAVSPQHPLRLLVTGRRGEQTQEGNLSLEELFPVTWSDTQFERRVLAIESSGPWRIDPSGESVPELLTPVNLLPAEADLLGEAKASLFLVSEENLRQGQLSFQPLEPRYQSEIRLTARREQNVLTVDGRLRIKPDNLPVSMLRVAFSRVLGAPPTWSLNAEAAGQINARRMTNDDLAAAGLPAYPEAWELELRRPQSLPFELLVRCSLPMTDPVVMPLVSLPEAHAQSAVLGVITGPRYGLEVTESELRGIPPGELFDASEGMHLAFRYDPESDTDVGRQPPLQLRPVRSSAAPAELIVWRVDHDIQIATHGECMQSARYWIERGGQDQCRFTLPPEAQLQHVMIDGHRQAVEPKDGTLLVSLPTTSRFVAVDISLQMRFVPLGLVANRQLPLISTPAPTVSEQAYLRLPAMYQLRGFSSLEHADSGPTIQQRLFGPLAASPDDQPWQPWELFEGSLLPIAQAQTGLDHTDPLLLRIGAALQRLGETSAGRTLYWKDLAQQLITEPSAGVANLLFDGQALMRGGLSPRTPLRLPVDRPLENSAWQLLQDHGLALLVSDKAALITSRESISLWRDQVLEIAPPTIYHVQPGLLAKLLAEQVQASDSRIFQTSAQWAIRPSVPWTETLQNSENNWSAYRTYRYRGEVQPAIGLSLVNADALRVVQIGLFLLMLAVGLAVGRHRGHWVLLGGGGLLLLALMVPSTYVPLTSMAFMGLLSSVLVRAALIPATSAPPLPSSKSATRIAVSLTFALVLSSNAPLFAQPPLSQPPVVPDTTSLTVPLPPSASAVTSVETPPARPVPPVSNVFIPIDENRTPTGERYLVPENLLQELRGTVARISEKASGWLLKEITYRGSLDEDPETGEIELVRFAAEYRLTVLDAPVRARIPLPVSGVQLLAGTVELDGELIATSVDNNGLLVLITSPGEHRVRVPLEPIVQTTMEHRRVGMQVPHMATSRLDLTVPQRTEGLQVLDAAGNPLRSQGGRIVTPVAGSGELNFQWSRVRGGAVTATDVRAVQLFWLEARAGGVMLHVKTRYRATGGLLRKVRWSVDPALRLLPATTPDGPVGVQTQPSPTESIITFDLGDRSDDEVTVSASFLMTDAQPVGNLRLPRVESLTGITVDRRLALEVESSLQISDEIGDDFEETATADFVSLWGNVEDMPVRAYRLEPGGIWGIGLQPANPTLTATQATWMLFEPSRATIHYQAEITARTGYTFQLRVHAPPQLNVERVRLETADGVTELRWVVDDFGVITIFCREPFSTAGTLTIRGTLATPASGPYRAPRLSLRQATVTSEDVHVFRSPGVLIELAAQRDFSTIVPTTELFPGDDVGRRLFSLNTTQRNARLVLTLEPNQVRTEATQLTRLFRQDSRWHAEVDCLVIVRSGRVDRLRFEIPSNWSGPFQLEPATLGTIVQQPAGEDTPLVIRLRQSSQDTIRLRLRAPLSIPAGQRVRAPAARLLDTTQLVRFVALPTQSELQTVEWETRGIVSQQLPSAFADNAFPTGGYEFYRVISDDFQGMLRTVATGAGVPEVPLADIIARLQGPGQIHTVAAFDVRPAGQNTLRLSLPAQHELLRVTVDGRPTMARSVADDAWLIRLGPEQLPQRVEVIYQGTIDAAAYSRGDFTLQAPRLGDLPVQRTIWRVQTDAPVQVAGSVTDQEFLRLAIVRLENLASLLDLPPDVIAEQTPRDLAAWYTPWCKRWLKTREQAQRLIAKVPAGEYGRSVRAELAALEEHHRRVAETLGVGQLLATLESQPREAADAMELWGLSQAGTATQYHVFTSGFAHEIAVTAPRQPWGPYVLRAAVIAAIIILLAWLYRGQRLEILIDASQRLSLLMAVLIGLGWWLWLQPSYLGILIILGGFIMAWLRLRAPRLPASQSPGTTTLASSG